MNWRVLLAGRLDGDLQRRTKKFRSEVRAVRPDECPKLRVHLKLEKEVTVPQRLKYPTVNFIDKIHFAFNPITETKPEKWFPSVGHYFWKLK